MNNENEIAARDRRIAYHEVGHLTVGRALGAAFGGATIEPNPQLGYGGLCWSPDFKSHFAGEASTTSLIEKIDGLMPRDGDTRTPRRSSNTFTPAPSSWMPAVKPSECTSPTRGWPPTTARRSGSLLN